MRKNITTLKGWTITKITVSGHYYSMTLERGGRTKIVTIGVDQIFDGEGMSFVCNI